MTKALILYLCVILIATSVHGAEESSISQESSISAYKDNYIQNVTPSSDEERSYTHAQLSLKFQPLPYALGSLYIGVTNTFCWRTGEKSMEVSEMDHNIDLFYRFSPRPLLSTHLTLDRLQIGMTHISNGKKGLESRSTNFAYGEVGGYAGERFRLGGMITGLGYIDNSTQNEDIEDYTGNFIYETYLSAHSQSREELARLSYRVRLGDNTDLSRGRQEVMLKITPFPRHLRAALFIKYDKGYGICGVGDYDKESDVIMVGVSIL